MTELKKIIKTIIRDFLNEQIFIDKNERTQYNGYSVGDVIISDGDEPFTGDNVFPIKGAKYKLIQFPLNNFNLTRNDVYESQGIEYKDEEDFRLDEMKKNFDKTPPIPEENDGMHRIVIAKELGYKTILMWKQI